MEKRVTNLFAGFSLAEKAQEVFDEIINRDGIRIERICSSGQKSPDGFWYDQEENEWVVLLEGEAVIEFADGPKVKLVRGDYILINAHQKHKVTFTSYEPNCIWLAVFWKPIIAGA